MKEPLIQHCEKASETHASMADVHHELHKCYAAKVEHEPDEQLAPEKEAAAFADHHARLEKLHRAHAKDYAALGKAVANSDGGVAISEHGFSAAMLAELLKKVVVPDNVRGVIPDNPRLNTLVPRSGQPTRVADAEIPVEFVELFRD